MQNTGNNVNLRCADGRAVSRMALGTMYFGTRISLEDSRELLDTYVSMGGNQIDTARSYASWLDGQDGTSERAIGAWLKEQGKREALFIGTKGGLMPRGYNEDRGNLERSHLEEELCKSLKALGTGYVDVFWLHRDERRRPVEEIVDSCDYLIRSGMTRYIGVSNWSVGRIEEANAYAKVSGRRGFDMSQIQFGLGICTPNAWGDPSVVCMDDNSYEWYKKKNMLVYAYSAQAQGFFSLYAEQGIQAVNEDTRQKYLSEENIIRAKRLMEISRETGISVSALVLNYVMTREFDTCLVLGCSRKERLMEAMASIGLPVPAEQWEILFQKCVRK